MKNEIKKIELSCENDFIGKEFTKKVGNYLLSEQIGIGTFSKVTKGIHILTGEKIAVKILDKSKIKDEIDIEHITREIEILKSISHRNICQLYESISTDHNFYLIMEYIDGGDLGDFISKNIKLSENLACHFFRQLISAIEYLNDMGITHRDLKPENILLDSSHNNIKVIDFGLSNYCANRELFKTACGSPCFASPEMLSGNSYLGVKTDLWSAGIVLYIMLVGNLPFDDQELNTLYQHIKIGTFYIPSNLSLESIDFLKKILQVNPDKRITIEEIKKHSWFNNENNILYKGIDLTVETFPYNEKLIEYVITKYYKNDRNITSNNFIIMLKYHACNQYTTTYYLVEKKLEKYKDLKFEQNKSGNNENLIIPLDALTYNEDDNLKYIGNHKKIITTQLKSNGIINIFNEKENKNNLKLLKNNKKINNLRNENKSKLISRNRKISDKAIVQNNIKKYFSIKGNNKKMSHKITSIFQYLNDFKESKNKIVNKKPKTWSKNKNKLKLNKNKRFNKNNIYNHLEKFKYQIKQNNILTQINPINSKKKSKENNKMNNDVSSISKGEFSNNSNVKEKKDKIGSIKIEKQKKYIKNFILRNKENILNKTEANSLNYMNFHKYNESCKEKNENKDLELNEKCGNILSIKKKKKIYIKTNFNNKTDLFQNNYYLTENNLNKVKFSEPNQSLILKNKGYLGNKNLKEENSNKSFNKYKNIVDKFRSKHSDKKNETNKKMMNYENKVNFNNNIKNENKEKKPKYKTLNDSSYNKSIINQTKLLNNKIDNNILKNSVTLSLKYKINSDINNNKSKIANKNIRQKKVLNKNINNNNFFNNNKTSNLFYNKLKINNIKEKLKDNIQNYTYIKTERNNLSKEKINKNYKLKKLTLSPCYQNNYNEKTNNNKIINININNILKIKKQYSLSFAKSNDGSSKINHFINNNYGFSKDKNENKIKNNNHSVPLSLKKQTNKDKKKAIKQFRKNVFKDIKNDINNKKINFDLKHNKKYSSLLKKYLLAE